MFWIGFMFIDFAQNWPSWAPGPSPWSMVWIPFAIGIGGAIMMLWGFSRQRRMLSIIQSRYQDPQTLIDPFSKEYTVEEPSRFRNDDEIIIPEVCSKCEYALPRDGLEWVGPMEFKCPYCGQTQRAKRE